MERKNERLPIFTERFRELQGERSNTEFAEFLEVSRQTVGFYCNGDRIPDALTLKQIAEKCEVSVDWLLGLSNAKSTKPEIRKVCDYTGLSQQAAEHLHSIEKSKRPAAIDIVNEVVRSALLFNDCLYRSVLAEAQYKKVLSRYSAEEIRRHWENKEFERIESAFTPLDKVEDGVEVSAGEAAVLFEIQAIENIKRAAERVINRYRQEIIPLMTKDC